MPRSGEKRLHRPLVGAFRRFLGHLGWWPGPPLGGFFRFALLLERGSAVSVGPVSASAGPRSGRGGRTRSMAVALTPEEHASWRDAATLAGRPQLAAWVRDTVNRALEGRALPVPGVVYHLEALAGELGREGSNLNQAVKALNAIAASGVVDQGQAQRALAEVERAAYAVTVTQRKIWVALDEVGQ